MPTRRWLPFAWFIAGFAFDVVTLRGEVSPLNLAFLAGNAAGTGTCLVLGSRSLGQRLTRWVVGLQQFLLGSLFSALVVLYFRSAGELFTLLTCLALFAAMVSNEFGHRQLAQRGLLWTLYCLALVMLLNFLVPHLLMSVAALWFYLSTALAVALLWLLALLARERLRTVLTATAVAAFLPLLYLFGWIPPVPLIQEHVLVGTGARKSGGEYSCLVQDPSAFMTLATRLGLVEPTVYRRSGEAVAVLTAVSAPRAVEVHLEHRWYRRRHGRWERTDTIPFDMIGGRRDGWRFWSQKHSIRPGRWRVETALVGGPVLGYQTFQVAELPPHAAVPRLRATL
jgi:hypothetical protein